MPAEAAAEALLEVTPRLARLLAGALESGDAQALTLRQFRILQRLASKPHRSGELASSTGVSAPTMSVAIAGLESAGLVERQPDPQDRRAWLISMTTAGEAAYRQARRRLHSLLVEVAAELNADDADALQRLRGSINAGIDRVRRRMREAPGAADQPPPGSRGRSSPPRSLPIA